MTEPVEAIRLISIFSVVIPLLTYLYKIKRLPKENHVIGVAVVISALIEMFVTIQSRNGSSNIFAYNLYFILIFATLCWYYYEVVFKFKNLGYFYFGIGLYVIGYLLIGIRQDFTTYQGEMWALTGLILVVFGITYNNYQVEKPPLLDRNLYSGLIFNAAIMLYFSFNFSLFIIANYVLTELSPETSRMTWTFHNVNNIIKNIAFAAGLYYTNRRRLNLTDEEVERIQWGRLQ